MLPDDHPDRIQIAFDDHHLVNNAGLILPATLALHLGVKGGEKMYRVGVVVQRFCQFKWKATLSV